MEFLALCSMINLPPRLPKILYFFLIETLDSESVSSEIRTASHVNVFYHESVSTVPNTKGLAKSIRNFREPLTS